VTEKSDPANGLGWRTTALVLAAVLVLSLIVFGALFASGWRFYRLDELAGPAPAAPASPAASAEKWSPPLGPGESAASRAKRLARDLASLSFAPTNRPDPGKVLAEARDLATKGQYEEALQRHLWYHNHALEYSPSQSGVRLSFALSYWIELSRKFPKARQALLEIRDRDNREFAEGKGDFALFQEVSAINSNLQADDETVVLFKSLLKQDPELARQCYLVAEDVLVRTGEYEICLTAIPDSQARFSSLRQEMERTVATAFANPQLTEFAYGRFVKQTRALIEILVAGGRKPEAEKIRAEALTVLDDPRLASAVMDAEKKTGK
jgi:hypothetical protein